METRMRGRVLAPSSCRVGELEVVVDFRPSPSCCKQGLTKGEWLSFIDTPVWKLSGKTHFYLKCLWFFCLKIFTQNFKESVILQLILAMYWSSLGAYFGVLDLAIRWVLISCNIFYPRVSHPCKGIKSLYSSTLPGDCSSPSWCSSLLPLVLGELLLLDFSEQANTYFRDTQRIILIISDILTFSALVTNLLICLPVTIHTCSSNKWRIVEVVSYWLFFMSSFKYCRKLVRNLCSDAHVQLLLFPVGYVA